MVSLVISIISLTSLSINIIKKPLGLAVGFSYIQMLLIVSEETCWVNFFRKKMEQDLGVNKVSQFAEFLLKLL